jgi:hypothetical protein
MIDPAPELPDISAYLHLMIAGHRACYDDPKQRRG